MNKIFSCTRCGYCCHGETTVSLDAEDQVNMLDVLKISRTEALKRYWRETGSVVQMQIIDGHCVFYQNGCTVHAGRPKKCREWPLVKAIVTDEINLDTIRTSCPGISPQATYSEVRETIECGNPVKDVAAENAQKS